MTLYLRMLALFFVLTGLLLAIGYAIGLYFGDPLLFMALGLVLAGVVNFASYFWSDKIVVKMTRAKIIQESENPNLFAVVRSVAEKAQIPMPKVGIVSSRPAERLRDGPRAGEGGGRRDLEHPADADPGRARGCDRARDRPRGAQGRPDFERRRDDRGGDLVTSGTSRCIR